MQEYSGGLFGFYLVIQGILMAQLALPVLGHAADSRVEIDADISVQWASGDIPESIVDLLSQVDVAKQQHLQQQKTFINKLNVLKKSRADLVKQQAFYQNSADTLQGNIRQASFKVPSDFSETEAFATRFKRDNYFLKVAGHRRANNPFSPLLDKLEILHCTEEQEEAKSLLSQLLGISPQGRDWPDEWLGQQAGGAMLFAGSMDIALSTIYRTIERFPVLKALGERVTLQWNYCPLLGEAGAFNNLQLKGDQLLVNKAEDAVPLNWDGFRRWGFLDQPGDDDGRYVPELLDISIPYYAYEIFLHRIHQLRCFPHPTTGQLYVDAQQGHFQHTKFYPQPRHKPAQKYPFNWYPYCELPQVKHRQQATWPEHLFQRVGYKTQQLQQALVGIDVSLDQLEALQKEQQVLYQSNLEHLKQQISLQLNTEKTRVAEQKKQQALLAEKRRLAGEVSAKKQRLATIAAEKKRRAVLKAVEQKRVKEFRAKEQRIAAIQAEKTRLAAALALKKQRAAEWTSRKLKESVEALAHKKRLAELAEALAQKKRLAEFAGSIANFAAMVPPSEVFAPIPDVSGSVEYSAPVVSFDKTKITGAKKKDEKLNLSATFLYNIPADGSKPSTKLSVGWKPVPNWFTRAALKHVRGEDFTYSWGVGYSNWRPGTTSFQLNNWGPIKSGEGLALDKAVMSISHKIDSQVLRDYKISTSVGISRPISGDLAVNGTFQWSPIPNWYFRTTASQKVTGEPTKWSYGFGYFDWRPETWRIEYSNYSNNRYPFDNFREGSVTISRAWEF